MIDYFYRLFHFRSLAGPEPDIEWADNWLSNALAWVSAKAFPRWCSTPDHWSVRLTEVLWTDCPCCLGFRFLALGLGSGMIVGILLGAFVW